MKRKKRLLPGILLGVCLLFAAGCAGQEEETEVTGFSHENEDYIVVGFSQVGAESDWRSANTESIRSALSRANGYDLLYEDAQQKQENQIKAIRNFILQEVNYIVCAPIVETGWDGVLQEAKDAGIPVILADRMVAVEDDSLYTCWIGADFEREGEDAGKWLLSYLEEQGRTEEEIQIVTLQGTLGASAQLGRTKGFGAILETQANWTMLDMQDGDFTQAKGREVMESFLEQYPDIDVVVCENDNMAFGAIAAIKAAGKTCGPDGDIIIISFDAVHAAFEAMAAGDMNVSIECNPLHGEKIAEVIEQLERGETPQKIIYMEEGIFPAETAKDYLDSRPY